MVDFFDYLYWKIPRKSDLFNKLRVYSMLRFFVRVLSNILIPIYFRFTKYNIQYRLNSNNDKKKRIIVSLTSFPVRINRLWLVVETLFRQSVKPDMIILWLSRKQFSSLEELPCNLLEQQKRGLRIELRDDDLRSHKKYFYMLKEYPDDIMIIVDDDIFYRTDMISTLVASYKENHNSIIANYAFKMLYDKNGNLLPYNKWINNNYISDSLCGYDIFFGSGGGTLFPINSLNKLVCSSMDFMHICPLADDVWLNAMCRINDYPVLRTAYNSLCLPVLNKNDIRLTTYNVLGEQNDIQILSVRNYCLKKLGIDPFVSTQKRAQS